MGLEINLLIVFQAFNSETQQIVDTYLGPQLSIMVLLRRVSPIIEGNF